MRRGRGGGAGPRRPSSRSPPRCRSPPLRPSAACCCGGCRSRREAPSGSGAERWAPQRRLPNPPPLPSAPMGRAPAVRPLRVPAHRAGARSASPGSRPAGPLTEPSEPLWVTEARSCGTSASSRTAAQPRRPSEGLAGGPRPRGSVGFWSSPPAPACEAASQARGFSTPLGPQRGPESARFPRPTHPTWARGGEADFVERGGSGRRQARRRVGNVLWAWSVVEGGRGVPGGRPGEKARLLRVS